MSDNESQGLYNFEAQGYPLMPGARNITMYVREPLHGCDSETGLMLMLHNWGGTWEMMKPCCDELSDRYNVVGISVNYLHSGKEKPDGIPYDHGLFQAMDCLRAIYHVQERLRREGKPFNGRRLYSTGASGGGNVSLMVNKLASASFSCIVDICGMPGLIDKIAYGTKDGLNAGYSRDPASPAFLTPAMQEIRDPGNKTHLAAQFLVNPHAKVIIIHGQDDASCPVVDKINIFRNMVETGFRPSAVFVSEAEVDGIAIKCTGHSVGDRIKIVMKYGDQYLRQFGIFAAHVNAPTDFELGHKVAFPVTGGTWTVDFNGPPTLFFTQNTQ